MGTEANRMEIANRIKKARKEAGLTQVTVAQKLGLTPQAISNYERGINNIPASLLMDLASLYGLKEFSFLDALPEPYQLGKSLVNDLQYSDLEYKVKINNLLSDAHEFERRSIIQEEIEKIKPNDVELFLAEKLKYGSRPDKEISECQQEEIDLVCTLLDALLYIAMHENTRNYRIAYTRIEKLVTLLQEYDKIKRGCVFAREEPFDPPRSGLNLSSWIKKHDPDNLPDEDFITVEKSEDGKPILILHETSAHSVDDE